MKFTVVPTHQGWRVVVLGGGREAMTTSATFVGALWHCWRVYRKGIPK